MYTKSSLIADIEKFQPADEKEQLDKVTMLGLLNATDHCFERHNFPAHFTGSALVVSPNGQKVLLTHHKTLNRWFQFGGHADGEINIANVAMREAQEESGIEDITPLSTEIFDIDIHPIPANAKREEPAHFHYDIRYLLRANTLQQIVSDESHDVRWFAPEELKDMDIDPALRRMFNKWLETING